MLNDFEYSWWSTSAQTPHLLSVPSKALFSWEIAQIAVSQLHALNSVAETLMSKKYDKENNSVNFF